MNEPIVVECVYNISLDRVWDALTDPLQMKQWFFEQMESFVPQIGYETKFNVKNGENNYLHLWKIIDLVPKKKIIINWRYGGYPGDSQVRFELISENEKTRLRITHNGMETFPQDNPDFSRESCQNGWRFLIGNRLREFLNADINY